MFVPVPARTRAGTAFIVPVGVPVHTLPTTTIGQLLVPEGDALTLMP